MPTAPTRSRLIYLLPALTVSAIALPTAVLGQNNDSVLTAEAFMRPPSEIAEAVLAPRHLNVTLGNPSPDGRFVLQQRGDGPPSMAMFAKPFYRLGGQQIDWQANRARQLTTRSDVGLELTDAATGIKTTIQIPDGARVSAPAWSPDGSQIAFLVHTEQATHIYVADPTTGRSRSVTRTPVLATLLTSLAWTPDSRSIVTVLVPGNRGAPPVSPPVPTAPQVRLTTPESNQIRTYPDLLEDPYERALLEFYSTGQLAVVDVARRRERSIGSPAMITALDVSPGGDHVLVSTMRQPFSYIVPTRQFAGAQEIWNLTGGAIVALVSEQDVRDGSPTDSTNGAGDTERRTVAWRPDGGLSFLQMAAREPGDTAQADENENREGRRSGRKDRVVQWLPPYDSASATIVYENTGRLSGVRYSADAETLFLTEQQGQNAHEFAVLLSEPETKHTISRGPRARFGSRRGAPRLLTSNLENGVSIVRTSENGGSVFVTGTDNADDPTLDGPITYVDRLAFQSGDKERIYESPNDDIYERLIDVLDDDVDHLLVSRESSTEIPNSFVRVRSTGELRQLTQNTDYTPDLTHAVRRRYAVKRADGFEFAVNVTLPQDWSGERLPGMVWFYPREYTDQDNYDEGTRDLYNKNAFPNIRARTMDILVRDGYAVIAPDAPIVGESGRMNDNYVHDLRNNMAATIDFLDKEGIIDRERMGVGGHSYGAFSTVNAMVNTPFFKAGIAGDGNYNRTLTPFSFQSERRTVWEARDLYYSMSPLFYANNLTGALLLYHGKDDQNVGTFPIHSWRLFESLESLGKTASMYVYPYEEHGPATEETLLDLWARWTAWLDKYVKNAGEEDKVTAE